MKIQEYWYDGNSLTYADGDVGDFNHAGVAIGHYQQRLLALMDMEDRYNAGCFDMDGVVDEFIQEDGSADIDEWLRINHPCQQFLSQAAFSGETAMECVMRDEGWVKINRSQWGVWFLRREDFDNLRSAMREVLDAEGCYGGTEEEQSDVLETEITVYVVSTGNSYHITLRDLEDNNYEAMQIHVPPDAPSDVAVSLDRSNNLACYGSNLGD